MEIMGARNKGRLISWAFPAVSADLERVCPFVRCMASPGAFFIQDLPFSEPASDRVWAGYKMSLGVRKQPEAHPFILEYPGGPLGQRKSQLQQAQTGLSQL